MNMYYVNSFFEDLLFPLIEPLDNVYLFGGQVVEFVNERVYFQLYDNLVQLKYFPHELSLSPDKLTPSSAEANSPITFSLSISNLSFKNS